MREFGNTKACTSASSQPVNDNPTERKMNRREMYRLIIVFVVWRLDFRRFSWLAGRAEQK